jgi:hypothetical protein
MALIDYKIVQFSHEGRHVKIKARIYRGAVTTEQEEVERELVDVTRYRRNAMVRERVFEYDVPRDMTRQEFITKVRAYLNSKLIQFAQANGHTVIDEQQDISELESVVNETET